MKDKKIFPEHNRLEELNKRAFIANIIIIVSALIFGMVSFLFLVWATVKLLQYMGVL